MVRPSVSVLMAESFCCSSPEIKELPGVFQSICLQERKKCERNESKWCILVCKQSHIRGVMDVFGCVMFFFLVSFAVSLWVFVNPSRTLDTVVVFNSLHVPWCACMTNRACLFVCAVHRSICHLSGVKGWPTFSCAAALCSGWVGVQRNTVHDPCTSASHVHCNIDFVLQYAQLHVAYLNTIIVLAAISSGCFHAATVWC